MYNVEQEREYYRAKQREKAAAVIGPLLDAWDNIPNDVKCDEELEEVAKYMGELYDAMDCDSWPDEDAFQSNSAVQSQARDERR